MRRLAIVAALLGITTGCATRPAPAPPVVVAPPPPRPAPPPRKVKLAVLPTEKLVLPKVAEALNERLSKANISGVSETTAAPISMEMALLQVECAQPSDECYGRIAKRLEADRLLWGEIEQRARAKKKKAPATTTVRIVMYDVDRATIVGRAEETFSGPVPDEALDEMLNRATTAEVPPRKVQP
jgi:hypothetical protein